MSKDTMTGILGAVVLVAAMTGVFFYERGQFAEYDVSWDTGPATSAEVIGRPLAHGDARTHTFTVSTNQSLVQDVTVRLNWSSNTGDEFEIHVTAPNETTTRQTGTGGSLKVKIPVQGAPATAALAQRNRDGAIEHTWNTVHETALAAGRGEWTIRITLIDAMRPNEIPVLNPEEGENDYRLTFTHEVWTPTLSVSG